MSQLQNSRLAGIQNPESRIQNPESRIQNPESRIQNEIPTQILIYVLLDVSLVQPCGKSCLLHDSFGNYL